MAMMLRLSILSKSALYPARSCGLFRSESPPMSLPALILPPGIAWPVKRSPATKSGRIESVSGRRTILPFRSVPRWNWEIPIEFLRSAAWGIAGFAELETLLGFYNAQVMSGMAFTYQDAEDNAAVNAPFGVGDGVATSFQLVRGYGGFSEPVYAPTGTLVINIAGVPTSAYTLGPTGIVTFAAAPAVGALLTWTGSFSWICRFDEDTLDVSRFMQGLSSVTAIKFSNEIAL